MIIIFGHCVGPTRPPPALGALLVSICMSTLQVVIGDKECEGTGPNKRLAKRSAAEAMLSLLGYAKLLPPPPDKPTLKRTTSADEEDDSGSGAVANGEPRRVKFDLNTKDTRGKKFGFNVLLRNLHM